MSVSAAHYWACCSVWALCRAACPLRRENIDFFPWITRLDRLGCMPEFDCFLSLLVVHTDLRRTHQNSECLHAAADVCRDRQLWLTPFSTRLQTGWLITTCLMFNQGDWTRERQISAAISGSFDWLNTALYKQTEFWKFLTVPHLESSGSGSWEYFITTSQERSFNAVWHAEAVAGGSNVSFFGFSTLKLKSEN